MHSIRSARGRLSFLFALAAAPFALHAGPESPPPSAADRARMDIASALQACEALPVERQRACVEPYLDDLPPQVARALRFETDPAMVAAMARWQAAADAAMRAQARTVAARGGARDLLAAAFLWPLPKPDDQAPVFRAAPEARAFFAQARAIAPTDPLVAWLVATDCGGLADDCDRDAGIDALLVADPGNAAVQLLALGAARERGDRAAVARHLRAAAAADRYAPYFTQLLPVLFEAHEGVAWPTPDPALGEALVATWGVPGPATAGEFAAVMALGRVMAVAYPGLVPLSGACPADGSGDPAWVADCRAVYALAAEQSDSMLDRMIALAHLARYSPGEAGDHWRAELAELHRLQEALVAMPPGAPGARISGADYVRLVVEKGELGAMRALAEIR